jgi:hypothetical protein
MSRGIGKLQRDILDYVNREYKNTKNIAYETMRWSLYDRFNNQPIPSKGTLPNKWDNSLKRAIIKLSSEPRKLLFLEKRRLSCLEECIAHYPGKTFQMEIRQLRLNLLPALLEWTQEENGARPHHNVAANEKYQVKQLLLNDKNSPLPNEWRRLESLLRPIYGRLVLNSDDLFILLVKGNFLFRNLNVDSSASFTETLQKCCDNGLVKGDVASQLRTFSNKFFPPHAAGSLKLKSLMHRFADIRSRGRCSLNQATLEALYRLRKNYVESLPDFQPANTDVWSLEPMKCNILHKLFDHTVFQKFNFVHLSK